MGQRLKYRYGLPIFLLLVWSMFFMTTTMFGLMKRLVFIGYVDLKKIKERFPGINLVREFLSNESLKYEQEIDLMKQKLAQLQQKYIQLYDQLTPEQKKLWELKIQNARFELNSYARWVEAELAALKQRLEEPILKKIHYYILATGKAQGFSFVFNKETPYIEYFDPELDITQKVIDKMQNELHEEVIKMKNLIKKLEKQKNKP